MRLLAGLGVDPSAGRSVFDAVERAYSSPERHYHNLAHVADVLGHLCRLGASSPGLLLAGWLHDLVYDTTRSDNEARSALEAKELLARLGVAEGDLEEMARLILLTQSHEVGEEDTSGCLLLDADLAILGAAEAEYDAYAAAIRREYAWVPEERYRAGRAQVLERFLGRERIYRTAGMEPREGQARANLRREIAGLRGG